MADGWACVRRPARPADAIYHLDKADVVVSLDADFLGVGPSMVRYTRDFADRRRVTDDAKQMNRLYVIESSPTLTGAKAEHRLPIRSSDIEGFARSLAAALGAGGGQAAAATSPLAEKWLAAIAKDLQDHRGRSVVMAGEFQPAAVHALAHAINQALGNVGTTVTYGGSIEPQPVSQHASLAELSTAMEAGQVQLLVILGNNPVFTAPADVKFAERLAKVEPRRLPQPLPGRDLGVRSLEHPRHAPARDVGRSARVRRHRHADAAAHRAALRRALGPRGSRDSHEPASTKDARARQGLLDARLRRGNGMDGAQRRRRDVRQRRRLLEAGRARRVHSRHGHGERRSSDAVQGGAGRSSSCDGRAGCNGSSCSGTPAPHR